MNDTLYASPGVTITRTAVIVPGRILNLQTVTSVQASHTTTKNTNETVGFVIAIAGVLIGLGSIVGFISSRSEMSQWSSNPSGPRYEAAVGGEHISIGAFVLGVILTAVGGKMAYLPFKPCTTYHLVLTTTAGETQAINATNTKDRDTVQNALAEALAGAGTNVTFNTVVMNQAGRTSVRRIS